MLEDRSRQVREYVTCEGGRLPGETHCDEYHSSGPSGPDPSFVYWPKMMAQADDEAHAKAAMLRTRDLKYISRITGEDELYDLIKDPGERCNRIRDGEYAGRLGELRLELLRWYQRTCDVVPHELDRRFTDEMLWTKVKNLCPPGHEDEVKKKIEEGMRQGVLIQYVKELRTRLEEEQGGFGQKGEVGE